MAAHRPTVKALETRLGWVDGWALAFTGRGAVATMLKSEEGRVYGQLALLTDANWQRVGKLCGSRAADATQLVETEVSVSHEDQEVVATAYIVDDRSLMDASNLPVPLKYMQMFISRLQELGAPADYRKLLEDVQTTGGERDARYWITAAHPAKQPTPGRDTLCLEALRDFAIHNDTAICPLVEIGANMGKCSAHSFDAQLKRAEAAGVFDVILTGCDVRGSHKAQQLVQSRPGVPRLYFTAGVHPHDAKTCNHATIAQLRALAATDSCIAIGECGLDYDRMFSPREVQQQWFREQLVLAKELDMSLFCHERDRGSHKGAKLGSCDDFIAAVTEAQVDPARVCVHCFTGDEADCKRYVAMGMYIGLTGFVGMLQRGQHVRSLLERRVIPLERLMLETDSPFMQPDKNYFPAQIGMAPRKMEPCGMPAVCRAVAECYCCPPQTVAEITTANAIRFFGLRKQ